MKPVFPQNTIIRENILQIKNSHLPCSFYLHACVLLKCPRTNMVVCGGINPSFSLRLYTTTSLTFQLLFELEEKMTRYTSSLFLKMLTRVSYNI